MKKTLITLCCLLCVSAMLSAQAVVKDSLELDKGVSYAPAQLLKGKVAGVRISGTDNNPNGLINTNIRGINSVRGTNEPLWIVDGAVLSSSVGENLNAFWQDLYAAEGYDFSAPLSQMAGINLYDIESIEILKDASAAAIYGARGANGVIIIKTKTPVQEKRSINWNSNVGIETTSVGGFKPAFTHNHNVAIGSNEDRVAYRLSAFYRDSKGAVPGVGNQTGGLRMIFDTKANSVVQFGMNSALSVSKLESQAGATNFGEPSLMLALRDITMPNGKINDVDGYLSQYQDQLKNFRTTTSFYLNLNFTPAFHFNNTASVDYQTNSRYLWYGPGTAFGDQFENASGISVNSLLYVDYKPEFKYERIFANNHFLNLNAGVELIYSSNKFNTMNGSKIFLSDFKARGFGFRESQDNSAYFFQNKFEFGFFAAASYNYKNIVGASLSCRADRNIRYEDEYTFYPAAEAYFDFKNALLDASNAVSALKFKAGYGKTGYGKFSPYAMFTTLTGGDFPVQTEQEAVFFEGFNKLTTREAHITLETSFFNNRLGATLTFYDRRTADDLDLFSFGHKHELGLLWVEAPRHTVSHQSSSVRNNGSELEINARIISKANVSWDVDFNTCFNTNTLLSVDPLDEFGYKLNYAGTVVNGNVVGNSLSALLAQGYNTVPTVFGGLGTTLKVYNFTLDIQSDFAGGHYLLNMNSMLAAGVETPSSKYVESGDYFRLSRASLQYELPMKNLSWIKSLAFSITGTNLLTSTKYSGWNPDVNCFGFTNLGVGIDYASYPLARTILLGVKANF